MAASKNGFFKEHWDWLVAAAGLVAFAASAAVFVSRLGTSPEGCEGWLMYGAEAVMDVSELMVAKADEATLDRLEEAVQARLEAQLDVFRGYGVDQAQLLEDAAVLRRGSYLFYAVDAYADQWEDVFLSCIR